MEAMIVIATRFNKVHVRSPHRYRYNDDFALSTIEEVVFVAKCASGVVILMRSMVMTTFNCVLDLENVCCD